MAACRHRFDDWRNHYGNLEPYRHADRHRSSVCRADLDHAGTQLAQRGRCGRHRQHQFDRWGDASSDGQAALTRSRDNPATEKQRAGTGIRCLPVVHPHRVPGAPTPPGRAHCVRPFVQSGPGLCARLRCNPQSEAIPQRTANTPFAPVSGAVVLANLACRPQYRPTNAFVDRKPGETAVRSAPVLRK
jgi:hypothetical protein